MDAQNKMMNEAPLWQTRATAYELLAFSFRYPDMNLVEAVVSGEWTDAVHELAEVLALDLPDNWECSLSVYSQARSDDALHTLRAEATRLFVGAPTPVVSPFEGVCRAEEDGVQALLFVNPHSMAVERTMKTYGIGRPENTNEPLDHVATELEFLQWLCMLEAGSALTPAGVALPEGGWTEVYESFLDEHARVWMPTFAGRVIKESQEPFYGVAAGVLAEVIQ